MGDQEGIGKNQFLSSPVSSPHHLVAQGVEEHVARSFNNLDTIIGLADGEACSFAASLASPVDGNEEVMATAFHVEGDFPVIVDDDGAHVEAVWRYRCDGNRVAMRDNDWTTDA